MTALDRVAEAVVTGAGVVTPLAGRTPEDPWFDYRARLGPRGYKYLPDACQYLLAAAREALVRAGEDGLGVDPAEEGGIAEERRAAAVGTNSAVAALHADITEVVREGGVNRLSPMTTPFFSVNLVASRLSTEYRLKGFNMTLTSPRVAGVEALHLASRELAAGRVDLVLAGATEAADPGRGPAEPEAGAVVLTLRPPDTAVPEGGAVLRTTLGFVPPAALLGEAGRRRGNREVREILDALTGTGGPGPDRIRLVVDGSPVAASVEAAVRDWSAGRVPVAVEVGGDRAGALAPLERLADGLLGDPSAPQVVVTAAREGNVAFASMSAPRP
ncbi:beta-ketoacyl synthase N-terminal-like domain-containing protein [Streptomyces sp. NPDC059258]|uniref:beta-ketoacyl synthase N-terminal-like domain-containing protein n=1 Tax=unclassified Streptomyces TaxID=2593676 RepID=UPI0036BA9D6D